MIGFDLNFFKSLYYMDHIFIINLAKDTKRYLSSTNQLKLQNISTDDYTRLDAVDGFNWCPYGPQIKNKIDTKHYSKLMRETLYERKQLVNVGRSMKPGEIGIIQSIRKLFNHVLDETEYKNILVLEDDFKLCYNFNDKLTEVLKYAPRDADLLYLGISSTNYKYGEFEDIEENDYWEKPLGITYKSLIKKFKCKGGIFGAYGFIINRKGMKAFLKASMPMTRAVDVVLGRLSTIDNSIKTFSLKEKKHIISYFKLGTTIQL